MIRQLALYAGLLLTAVSAFAQATFTINGISDRTTYNDSVSLSVPTVAGYSYLALLDGQPIAPDVTHPVGTMDYHELLVMRTNDATLATSNRLVRFIVISSRRGDPERGLIEWVPLPPISSTAAEMAGAQLDLVAPKDYPAGLEIPIIARVENASGKAQRVNGWVRAPGFETNSFRILRGVGFGLLPKSTAGTTIDYNGSLQSLQASKQINIEPTTTWTAVSGTLGNTTWPANSRISVTGNITIPAGVTLTIGAGTVVRLNPGVNITNTGATIINGTAEQPVVFTPQNRPAPESHANAWGGWYLRGTASQLVANHAIMTGSGFDDSISFSPGSSHRSEQPLFLVHSGAHVRLTNCAFINLAGQVGNGYFSTITWDRCLIQRAITVGEWEGCTNIINRSAMIEFPIVDGIYNSTIANADYDGIYMIRGTNFFKDSLFGFCKDDAIDFGSGGPGTGLLTNCWVESALHEALAWSGEGRRTWTYDTVLMNNGQGIEAGWSTGSSTPLVDGNHILSTANSVGARLGDNYTGTTGLGAKNGFLTVTNSIVIHNYRDVWGLVWDNTWNYRTNQMDIRSNYLTAPHPVHPSNYVWNPSVDGSKLAPFMSTPPNAPVGIGLATWSEINPSSDITNGVPVRLSSFTPNPVSVEYSFENAQATLASGTLTFQAGETVKRIFPSGFNFSTQGMIRVALRLPVGGEITGPQQTFYMAQSGATSFINAGATWKYHDKGVNLGTAWRETVYDDSGWSNGAAQLGFGDNDETTRIARSNTTMTASVTTYYFRRAFNATDVEELQSLSMWMLRDDGAVVYINGNEVFRSSSMPAGTVTYNTFANALGSAPGDNTIDTATISATNLVNGVNVVAVELHQYDPPSSDASFDFSLTASVAAPLPPQHIWREPAGTGGAFILSWGDSTYTLEEATTVTGVWTKVTSPAPLIVTPTNQQRFYRLRP